LRCLFDLSAIQEKVYDLEQETNQEGFWDDAENAGKVLKRIKELKDKSDKINSLKSEYEDLEVLIELGTEAQDESVIPEVEASYKILRDTVERFRIETLLKGQYDSSFANFAIISIYTLLFISSIHYIVRTINRLFPLIILTFFPYILQYQPPYSKDLLNPRD